MDIGRITLHSDFLFQGDLVEEYLLPLEINRFGDLDQLSCGQAFLVRIIH